MQWDDGVNAGFSSAPANDLYIPIDPDAKRPTVKEQINDEMLKKIGNYNLYSSKGKGKMQLPRVLKFKKKLKLRNESGVPVSDDEMSRRNDTAVKEGSKDTTAPKIMKIMKKNKYIKTEENADFNDTNNSKF